MTTLLLPTLLRNFVKLNLEKSKLFVIAPLFSKMSKNNVNQLQMDRLEKNAEVAEQIIADIYSKLGEIDKGNKAFGAITTPELTRLRQENEVLKLEVAKWKELLVLREIRNGGNPIIRTPSEVGKATEKAEVLTVKEEPAEAIPTKAPSATNTPGIKKEKKLTFADDKNTPSVGKPEGGEGASGEVDVSKLDFRIGLITECTRHPDAESLYVEKIDLAEGKPRTIISGLVKHVPIEEMQNRLVVVLANLKPAKMRGIMSEGMVMCASSPDKVEILIPPPGSAPGDLVHVEGYGREPEAVLNPKKKIFETVQVDLKTNEKKEATYKGKLWTVPGKGVVVTESLINTIIK